jgi:hypothetical protein
MCDWPHRADPFRFPCLNSLTLASFRIAVKPREGMLSVRRDTTTFRALPRIGQVDGEAHLPVQRGTHGLTVVRMRFF